MNKELTHLANLYIQMTEKTTKVVPEPEGETPVDTDNDEAEKVKDKKPDADPAVSDNDEAGEEKDNLMNESMN